MDKSNGKNCLLCCCSSEISEIDDPENKDENQKCCKCGKFCKDQFIEYFSKSGIHGFQYLAEKQRPLFERLLWGIILIVSFYGCVRLSYNVWSKWNENPVIVTFNEKATPIWKIPFPAITICPETKVVPEIFNYTQFYHKFVQNNGNLPNDITDEEFNFLKFQQMRALSQVCDYEILSNFNLTSNAELDVIETLESIGLNFTTLFTGCRWKSKTKNCDDLLSTTVTEEGICYTFNGLDFKDLFRDEVLLENENFRKFSSGKQAHWDLENGYDPKVRIENSYPERVLSAGYGRGLHITLRGFSNHSNYICRGLTQGFKVVLHSPNELPQISKNFIRLQYMKEIIVNVKPNMMTTTDDLKSYSPELRQCFFNEQRYLRYFKIYTKENCEAECLTNHTINECGCVHFSMPKPKGIRVCNTSDIQCYAEIKDNYLMHEFEKELDKSDDRCNCLPSCTSLSYDVETSQTEYDFKNTRRAYDPFYKNFGLRMSSLAIIFKDDDFITSRRSEIYDTTDFLANCGGVLGLFMGISALSIVEVIYFCTIRLCSNLRMRLRKKSLDLQTEENKGKYSNIGINLEPRR